MTEVITTPIHISEKFSLTDKVFKNVIGEKEPLSFLYSTTYVQPRIENEASALVDEAQKQIVQIKPPKSLISITEMLYLPIKMVRWFDNPIVSELYPEINSFSSSHELKVFIEAHRNELEPNTQLVANYRMFAQTREESMLTSQLKDIHNHIYYFKRALNRYLADEKDIIKERIKSSQLNEKDSKTLLKYSTMLCSKKMRNLYKFFKDVGTQTLVNKANEMYSYMNRAESVYNFVKFTMNNIIYQTGKTMVLSGVISSLTAGLTFLPSVLATGSVYFLINFGEAFYNASQDRGETLTEKFKNALTKAGVSGFGTAFLEQKGAFYITGFLETFCGFSPSMAFGIARIFFGSEMLNIIIMNFDNTIQKQTADKLATTYSMGMNQSIIKDLMLETKQSGIFKQYVMPLLNLPVKVLDWIAYLPNAIFTQRIFRETYNFLTGTVLSETLGTLGAFAGGKVGQILGRSTGSVIKKSLDTALRIADITWKTSCYLLLGTLTVVLSVKAFSSVTLKWWGWDMETQFIQLLNNISRELPSPAITIRGFNILSPLLTVFSLIENFIYYCNPGNSILTTIIGDIFKYIYSEHKTIIRLFANIPASYISSSVINSLKPYTEQYLSFFLPTYLFLSPKMATGTISSLEDFTSHVEFALGIGSISLGAMSLLSYLYSFWKPSERLKKLQERLKLSEKEEDKIQQLKTMLEETWIRLTDGVVIQYLDTLSNLIKNKIAGSLIDWLEVNYGRIDILHEIGFSWIMNKVVMDNYFNKALNDTISDTLTNFDKIWAITNISQEYDKIEPTRDFQEAVLAEIDKKAAANSGKLMDANLEKEAAQRKIDELQSLKNEYQKQVNQLDSEIKHIKESIIKQENERKKSQILSKNMGSLQAQILDIDRSIHNSKIDLEQKGLSSQITTEIKQHITSLEKSREQISSEYSALSRSSYLFTVESKDYISELSTLSSKLFQLQKDTKEYDIAIQNSRDVITTAVSTISQMTFMENYYARNQKLFLEPFSEAYTANANTQIRAILYNKFLPWSYAVTNDQLQAVNRDIEQTRHLLSSQTDSYLRGIKGLDVKLEEVSKAFIEETANGKSVEQALQILSEKHANLESAFKGLKDRLADDSEFRNTVEYYRGLNSIVLRQTAFNLARTHTDFGSYYSSITTVDNLLKKSKELKSKLDNIQIRLSQDTLAPSGSDFLMDKKFIPEELAGKSISSFTQLIKQRKMEEKVEVKEESKYPWYIEFIRPTLDRSTNYIYEKSRTLLRYAKKRNQNAKKSLTELKQVEENIKSSNISPDEKRSKLAGITVARKAISNQTLSDMQLVTGIISQFSLSNIQPSSLEEENKLEQLKKLVSVSKQQKRDIDIERSTHTETGIDYAISFDYDYIYETTFGGGDKPSDSSLPDFKDENILDDISDSFDTILGTPIRLPSLGLFSGDKKGFCSKIKSESIIDKLTRPTEQVQSSQFDLCYKLPSELLREVENFQENVFIKQNSIARSDQERLFREDLTNNLLYMWIVPEFRAKLAKIPISEEILSAVKTSMYSKRFVSSGLDRLFVRGIEKGSKNWDNIHLLYFFSSKTLFTEGATNMIMEHNIDEYFEGLKLLEQEREQALKTKVDEFSTLNNMLSDLDKQYDLTKLEIELSKQTTEEIRKASENMTWWEKSKDMLFTAGSWVIGKAVKRTAIIGRTLPLIGGGIEPTLEALHTWQGKIFTNAAIENEFNKNIVEPIIRNIKSTTAGQADEQVRELYRYHQRAWLDAAEKADSIQVEIDNFTQQKEVQCESEINWYSHGYAESILFRGTEMTTGILAPSQRQILLNFFADDSNGFRGKFIQVPDFAVSNDIARIQQEARLASLINE